MAMGTSKLHLPKTVATAVVNKIKETSTIAVLSPSSPQIFTDKGYMIFNGAAEADVTAGGRIKSSYEQDLDYVNGKTFKVQTTTRVTSELKWTSEGSRFQIIQSIQVDQAEAIGRALDYVVYHTISPKTDEPLTGLDALTARAVQAIAGDDDITNVDNLADQLNETYGINGIAISRTWASRLRKIRVPATGIRYYPEISLNLQVGTLDGIKAATSATVNGVKAKALTHVLAIMGDFSLIKWGMVRDITSEIIPYGDPDRTGVDLRAHNQIAYRTEAMFSYAAIEPKALVALKTPTEEGA